MRAMLGAAVLAAGLVGCTSVRVVQRDGCWVKQTQRLGQVREDLGPCRRPEPQWAGDRYTRVVQECVAQADYRWQAAAMAAWNRGEPLPPQPPADAVMQACMNESSRSIVVENDALKQKVSELSEDKKQLRASVEESNGQLRANMVETGNQLRASNDKLTEYLGQAAQKPAGTATATATSKSDGSLKTDTDSSLKTAPAAFEADMPISRAAHRARRKAGIDRPDEQTQAAAEPKTKAAPICSPAAPAPTPTPEGAKKTIAQAAGEPADAQPVSVPKSSTPPTPTE